MCQNECDAGQTCCKPCRTLSKLELLQSMVERARYGVNENSNYAFYSFPRLIDVLRKKDHRISYLRLGKLNAAKRIATQSRALADHKRFLRTVGTGKVERVDRLVRASLKRHSGIRGFLSAYDRALVGYYKPKSYTEEDYLRGVAIWKMGGRRVADFAHRSLGLPSLTTLRKHTNVPRIIPSVGCPKASDVAQNVASCFNSLEDVLGMERPKHGILVFDEIAVNPLIRLCSETNRFLGLCRHGFRVCPYFNNAADVEEVFIGLGRDKKDPRAVHYAKEVGFQPFLVVS